MNHSKAVYLIASSMITPLGVGTDENFNQLILGNTGIKKILDPLLFPHELPLAKIDDTIIEACQLKFETSTRFDSLVLACLDQLQTKTEIDLSSEEVLVVLSTTKGNIELLQTYGNDEKLFLSSSAQLIQYQLKQSKPPIIISNACISGLSAMIVAKRLLQEGNYKHALIIGCDVLTNFVISGFNSFHAISNEVCKPFDINRSGISLGEACAGLILSTEIKTDMQVLGGIVTNDSNHISGPSKTGEELAYCIQQSMDDAKLTKHDIDFISAHGTATDYNDEMESKAFSLSALHNSPVFSLKASYGHTLGASGVLETIISAECLKQNVILPSAGFTQKGVSGEITLSDKLQRKEIDTCLKTASGFGGCNAALILKKLN